MKDDPEHAGRAGSKRRVDRHDDLDAVMEAALDRREAGDLDGAIELLMTAASGDLAHHELAITLAKLLDESGQSARAEPWFRHALKLAPDDLDVITNYGTFLASRGKIAEGLPYLARGRELGRTMMASFSEGELDAIPDLRAFVAGAELNLARAYLELGEPEKSRPLIEPWLTDPERWPIAHDLLADLIEDVGADPDAVAREGLMSGHASPMMVDHLIESHLEHDPPDFAAIEQTLTEANTTLPFDWMGAAPEIEETLAQLRQRFARAVMRGLIEADTYPHLVALSTRPPAEPDD